MDGKRISFYTLPRVVRISHQDLSALSDVAKRPHFCVYLHIMVFDITH